MSLVETSKGAGGARGGFGRFVWAVPGGGGGLGWLLEGSGRLAGRGSGDGDGEGAVSSVIGAGAIAGRDGLVVGTRKRMFCELIMGRVVLSIVRIVAVIVL